MGDGGVVNEIVSFEKSVLFKLGSLWIVQILPGKALAAPSWVTVNDVTVKLVIAAEVKLTGELVWVAKLKLA